ncbi:MAG: glycosyltransferase [Pyrinomonadaceae bacterium]|nr:glycosyltransferase [Sphingobacteriaceae bacterium]
MEIKKVPITVITVIFNAIETIESTILSILEQSSIDSIEYIVIDGGSTDGSLDIIEKYTDRIDLFISEKDNGIYHAMNKGIILATGDYILFLNSGDEFFNENALSEIIVHLSGCDVLYGKTAIKYKDSKTSIRDFYPQSRDWKVIPYCHQSVLIKRTVLVETLFNTGYKIAADYDQYFRLKNKNIKFATVTNIISVYDNEGYSALNYKEMLREYMAISLLNHPGVFKKLQIFLYFSLKIYL